MLRGSQHWAKTRFERCSEKGWRWQRDRLGPGSNPRGPTWRSRLPTWRPEHPTRRPRRPIWRPRQPNLALRGHSKRVPVRPRAGPGAQTAQNRNFIDFSSIFDRFFNDFRSLRAAFGLCQALLLCSADSVRLTKRRRKTHGYRFRLAFGCSSLPVRVPRSNPQLASQRFTRCSKVRAPSNYIRPYTYNSSSAEKS